MVPNSGRLLLLSRVVAPTAARGEWRVGDPGRCVQLPATAAEEAAGHSGYSFPTPRLNEGRLSWAPLRKCSPTGRVAWEDKGPNQELGIT